MNMINSYRKAFLLLLIIAGFYHLETLSQSCLPEGIFFETQAQIDSFHINYPNCSVIEGNVRIDGADITNLSGLIGTDTIIGDFRLSFTDLTNLSGLDSLKHIGGDFRISSNQNLSDLSGLGNLSSIDGYFYIFDNLSLISIAGLSDLSTIGGYLEIRWNDNLQNLIGLENLNSIGSDLTIFGLNSLSNLSGLEGLDSIGRNLVIAYNPNLVSLDGLDGLASSSIISLKIYGNNLLSDCAIQAVCDYLSNPNGTVNIFNNANGCRTPPDIANSCGFQINCLPFGNYYFLNQSDVDSFQTIYPNCMDIGGNVIIDGEDISTLSGLDSINSIEGNLEIGIFNYPISNPNLTNLIGLEGLSTIGGDFLIVNNETLDSLGGLENLQSIGGKLEISSNDDLKNIQGLVQLNKVGGILSIGYCYNIINLNGLDNIDSIGGTLYLADNTNLENIIGLSGLMKINGDIRIAFNSSIFSLEGLDNINSSSIDSMYIHNNQSLSNCAVQSICEYLLSPNGFVDIHSNGTGCGSQEEILEACESINISEMITSNDFTLYPNPSNQQITLVNNTNAELKELTIYDYAGRMIVSKSINLQFIDVSRLPQGLYIIEIVTDKMVSRARIIIN